MTQRHYKIHGLKRKHSNKTISTFVIASQTYDRQDTERIVSDYVENHLSSGSWDTVHTRHFHLISEPE